MQLRLLPINIQREKVYKQLFPPDGNCVTWVRANHPNFPKFEERNVRLYLFYLVDNEYPDRTLIVPEMYELQIRNYLKDKDGFGDYETIYLEVDMELLLLYVSKSVSVIRDTEGQRNPAILIDIRLIDDDRIFKDWIESGMPEPWLVKK